MHSTPSSALMPRLQACPTPGRRILARAQTAAVAPDWRAGRSPWLSPTPVPGAARGLSRSSAAMLATLRRPCTPACPPPGRAARQAQRVRAPRLLHSGVFRHSTLQRMAVAPPPLHFRPCKAPVQQMRARCPGAAAVPQRGAPRSRAPDWRGRPCRHEAVALLSGAAHGKEARRCCRVCRAGRARRPGARGRAAPPGCCDCEAPPAAPCFEHYAHLRMAAAC